jgi:hypothetical protein
MEHSCKVSVFLHLRVLLYELINLLLIFNPRKDIIRRNTYLTSPLGKSTQNNLNILWFAFFRGLDHFQEILEV